jgi:8-oxo-dGTP pyrophosphatase MutT (NUDIX family)
MFILERKKECCKLKTTNTITEMSRIRFQHIVKGIRRCLSEGPYKGGGVLFFRRQPDGSKKILIFRRNHQPGKGLFSIPGGKMDASDHGSYVRCAIRETWEETRLNILPEDVEGVISISIPCFRWKTQLVPLKGRIADIRFVTGELSEPMELTPKEADRLPLTLSMRLTLLLFRLRN